MMTVNAFAITLRCSALVLCNELCPDTLKAFDTLQF